MLANSTQKGFTKFFSIFVPCTFDIIRLFYGLLKRNDKMCKTKSDLEIQRQKDIF